MKDHQPIGRRNLVDQVGGPEDSNPGVSAERMHMIDQCLATWNIKPDGGFVHQQHGRMVEQGSRDFDPSAVSPVQSSDRLIEPLPHLEAFELLCDAAIRRAAVKAMQGRMVFEVLSNREIEIQRGLLKDHAQLGQGQPGRTAKIMSCDSNGPCGGVIKPCDQGKQGGFAGPVGSEQNPAFTRTDLQRDLIQCLPGTVGVREILDFKTDAHGTTTRPQGPRPTATDFRTLRAATSMIEMSLLSPLAVTSRLSSPLNARFHTR